MGREQLEQGRAEADILSAIYARGRDNARTPMPGTAPGTRPAASPP